MLWDEIKLSRSQVEGKKNDSENTGLKKKKENGQGDPGKGRKDGIGKWKSS